jgi:hypothetical protein
MTQMSHISSHVVIAKSQIKKKYQDSDK